jgi:hypothetical protein
MHMSPYDASATAWTAAAATRLLRANLAVTQDGLAVVKRDERHAAVEQVVMSYQRMLTQSVLSLAVVPLLWPSS